LGDLLQGGNDMAIPTDPLFSDQWHLRNTASGEFDLNVVDVWDDYTGSGVFVAVMDDGVEFDHPDLDGNYDASKDYDFVNQTDTPILGSADNHGTAVAGIIGAEANNGIGGVGVALGSTIFGVKHGASLEESLEAISGQTPVNGVDMTADVVNMSLGTLNLSNFFGTEDPTSAAVAAMEFGVTNGRDGKGTIYVKSAGNERDQTDENLNNVPTETNLAAWNATPFTISVAAVQRTGDIDSYSTYGASVFVSAFGSPGEIVTTDRTGADGYDASSDFTNSFNGTSAAAPQVAGVVALMLEANSNLGWRDVQTILANSARHVGAEVGDNPQNNELYSWGFTGGSTWNGGGLHFSNDYGFGLVDAKAAVRLAETWGNSAATSANQTSSTIDLLNSATTLTGDGAVDSVSGSVTADITIEHVKLEVTTTQYFDISDWEIRIVGPDGTTSIVLDNPSVDNDEADSGAEGTWEFFYSNAFRGLSSAGDWRVEMIDADDPTSSPITVSDAKLTFFGSAASDDDVFIFTNEFSDYASSSTHSTSINAGAGTDILNAAAVDAASTIDLTAGTGTIDGVSVTLSGFENVFTGDGADTVTGSDAANELRVGRGDDSVEAGGGNDVVVGRDGNDFVSAGSGNDAVWAGAGDTGADTLQGGAGNDTMGGGAGADSLLGQDGNDVMFGGADNDYILGGNGQDTAWAGSGNDEVWGGALADEMGGGIGADTLGGGDDADTIYASDGNDSVFGGNGTDNAFGGDGNDTLIGGSGSDSLYGGEGNDSLIFQSGHGDDFVGGFKTRGDNTIDLSDLNLSGFNALGISQSGDDVVIDTSAGTITLWNTSQGDITASDFVF